MEIPWLTLNNLIHGAEKMRVPFPSSSTVMWATIFGIPVAVLLHDTSDSWLPTSVNVPILSWFLRKWKKDPQEKRTHMRIFRNTVIFTWIVAIMSEKNPVVAPLDYISGRVLSSNARRSLTDDIMASRRAAFGALPEIIGEDMFDDSVTRQQRDAALRRRHTKEEKLERL